MFYITIEDLLIFDEDKIKTSDCDDEMCVICLDYTDDPNLFLKTKCGHFFHIGCVREWAIEKNECPLCRGPLLGDDARLVPPEPEYEIPQPTAPPQRQPPRRQNMDNGNNDEETCCCFNIICRFQCC